MKKFYIDTETTGLLPYMHDIVQLAVVIEIDGRIESEHDWKVRPVNFDVIDEKALKTQNRTIEELKEFGDPRQAFNELLKVLDTHIDKYDKQDKFTVCGYNVGFDSEFLRHFFKKNGHKYYGSYFRNNLIVDPLQVIYFMVAHDYMPELDNYKLTTVCEFFGIEFKAHDALADIKATRELEAHLALIFEDSVT